MDMQQAYAGADLARLEERLAEAHAKIRKLQDALLQIDAINEDPIAFNQDIDDVLRKALVR